MRNVDPSGFFIFKLTKSLGMSVIKKYKLGIL